MRDARIWVAEPEGVYSVCSAYKVIQGHNVLNLDPIFRLIWIAAAPSNVCAFAWRVLLDRVPRRLNLLRRKFLSSSADAHCPVCQLDQESVDHVFIHCPFATKVWSLCYCWLGLQRVLPDTCRNHFLQHDFLGLNTKQNEVFRVIWLAVIWSLYGFIGTISFLGAVDCMKVRC